MEDESKKESLSSRVGQSFKEGTTPKFLGGKSEGGDAPAGSKAEKSAQAAEGLSSVEDNATKSDLNHSDDSLSGTRLAEGKTRGFYSKGAESPSPKSKIKPTGFKGVIKKGGPIYAILFTIFIAGGIFGGTQLFQPFSLVAQFTETFNTMHITSNLRSARFFRAQMKTGRTKSPYNIWGTDFKMSEKQISKLAAQGIEYDDDYKGHRVLKYTDTDGTSKIVAVDSKAAKDIGDGAVGFKNIYADNSDFFGKYNAGSMTWRGAIANWFGQTTNKFMMNNRLNRNTFDDFKNKVAEHDGDAKAATQDILAKKTEEIDGGGFKSRRDEELVGEEEYKGEDGQTETRQVYEDVENSKIIPGQTSNSGTYKMDEDLQESSGKTSRKEISTESGVRSKLNSIAGGVQKGANIACTAANLLGSISLLVAASEALQIINLTTSYFETVDKVKAGYGDEAPINVLTDALNDKKQASHQVLSYNGGGSDSPDNITENGIAAMSYTPQQVTEKTAMESSGISSLYGGGPVNPNDPSVQSFNFSKNISKIFHGLGLSMAGFETCAIAKIAANSASAIVDFVEVTGCILGLMTAAFTFGATSTACGPLFMNIGRSIAFNVAIGVTVAAIISTITPLVSSMLTRDLVSQLGGEDFGNALASGGNMYLGSTHRANGGSLGTRDKYLAFRIEQEKVIAENAKYERENLSPFDATSKYTFMGALLTNTMNLASTSSLMSLVRTTSSVVSSSISSLTPTSLANDLAKDLPSEEQYQNDCPYLASIGAVGDAFCNPYIMTDTSTMDYDPLAVIDYLDNPANLPGGSKSFTGNVTSDGNVEINSKSDLAKYIIYCANREPNFGIANANYINQLSSWGQVDTGSSSLNAAANGAIGAIPVIGDIIDVVSNQKALDNKGYISGESCVAGNNSGENGKDTPKWSQAKYYQRFIEDQSLAESMGLIKESAVAVFLDDYYKENPLDNTYEGLLARKSGLSKQTVIDILDIIEYGNYIADYHPEERYAFGSPVIQKEDIKFDNEYQLASVPSLLNNIVYADVRNRNFVV